MKKQIKLERTAMAEDEWVEEAISQETRDMMFPPLKQNLDSGADKGYSDPKGETGMINAEIDIVADGRMVSEWLAKRKIVREPYGDSEKVDALCDEVIWLRERLRLANDKLVTRVFEDADTEYAKTKAERISEAWETYGVSQSVAWDAYAIAIAPATKIYDDTLAPAREIRDKAIAMINAESGGLWE